MTVGHGVEIQIYFLWNQKKFHVMNQEVQKIQNSGKTGIYACI